MNQAYSRWGPRMIDLFGIEETLTKRTNAAPEAAALVEVLKALAARGRIGPTLVLPGSTTASFGLAGLAALMCWVS